MAAPPPSEEAILECAEATLDSVPVGSTGAMATFQLDFRSSLWALVALILASIASRWLRRLRRHGTQPAAATPV